MNIDDIVTEVRLDTIKSSKTGKDFNKLVVKFDNGYEHEEMIFDKAEVFVIESLLDGRTPKKTT